MRRRLLIVALFLLAGAVVNVAVVFAFPMWRSNAFPAAEKNLAIAQWPRPVPAEWSKLDRADRLSVPGISCIFAEGHDSQYVYRQNLYQLGWPLLCIEGQSQGYFPINQKTYLGLLTGYFPADGSYRSTDPSHGVRPPAWLNDWMERLFMERSTRIRLLPTRFAVNTIFYAAVLWLLIPGPFAVRRFMRAKRGLCPKCAYPVGESDVCSECGKALAKREKVAT